MKETKINIKFIQFLYKLNYLHEILKNAIFF